MRGIRRSIAFAVLAMVGMLCSSATWAQNQITVVRGDENYPPYEMVVNGKLSGLHIDLVNAAAARIGLEVVWQSLPWKRALLTVQNGEADGITYISKTPEREDWAIFLNDNQLTHSTVDFVVLKKNANTLRFDGNLSTFLENRTPIVLRGFFFGNQVLDEAPRIEAGNMEQMVGMLRANRSDVAVVNWADFAGAFKGQAVLGDVVPLPPHLSTTFNYIAFSVAKNEQDLARRFGHALKTYKATPAYRKLLKRYGIAH